MKVNKNIAEKCREVGIHRTTYYSRRRAGVKDLFGPRKRNPKHYITAEIKKLLEENGISKTQYYNRRSNGWSEFEATHVKPYADKFYFYKGKSLASQVSHSRYRYFFQLLRNTDKTVEEAIEHVIKLQEAADARQNNR